MLPHEVQFFLFLVGDLLLLDFVHLGRFRDDLEQIVRVPSTDDPLVSTVQVGRRVHGRRVPPRRWTDGNEFRFFFPDNAVVSFPSSLLLLFVVVPGGGGGEFRRFRTGRRPMVRDVR